MEAVNAGGAILLLLLIFFLYRAHRGQHPFNALDILMQNNRADKLAVVFVGSWLVTSWIMVKLTEQGKMNEGLLTLYAGMWVAPVMAALLKPTQPKPEQPA